jgi:GT2 family glycosyltransferase
MPVISIIIPVHNHWEQTAACLDSLARHGCDYPREIIVVNDGSRDETVAELDALGRTLFGKSFRSLHFTENRAFAAACNAGARAASGDLLFFLNNDTLATEGWAPPLVEALEQNAQLAAVGPLLLYPDDSVQHLGITFCPGGVRHLHGKLPKEHPAVSKIRRLQSITGAAFLIPTILFTQFGGFYEEYRNGYEDVDLCLHIRNATGKYFSCIPSSVIYHLESQSRGRQSDAEYSNSRLLRGRVLSTATFDAHIFWLRDGLVPVVDESCRMRVLLPDEEEQRLLAAIRAASPEERLRILRENPYCVSGREWLGERLLPAAPMEALELLYAGFRLYATLEKHKRLLPLAKMYDPGVFSNLCLYAGDFVGARRICRILLEKIRALNDASLEKLYEERLSRLRDNA